MKDFLILDLNKDIELYKHLSQFNTWLEDLYNESTKGHKIQPWFDIKTPQSDPIFRKQFEPVKLHIYPSNYFTISLINRLYQDQKDILIENVCCGIPKLECYLSQLGFYHFSLIDDFSQFPKEVLYKFVLGFNNYLFLNDLNKPSKVVNWIEYPVYPKRIDSNGDFSLYSVGLDNPDLDQYDYDYIQDSVELFCSYVEITETMFLNSIDYHCFFNGRGFVKLCTDPQNMLYVYCRKNKYEEFVQKLQPLIK
jgi:hypothetical protein